LLPIKLRENPNRLLPLPLPLLKIPVLLLVLLGVSGGVSYSSPSPWASVVVDMRRMKP
jgi:hypothetical protein